MVKGLGEWVNFFPFWAMSFSRIRLPDEFINQDLKNDDCSSMLVGLISGCKGNKSWVQSIAIVLNIDWFHPKISCIKPKSSTFARKFCFE